jgi:hypothetical protein
MPNLPNEEPKHYPKKAPGSVLVVSKLMHRDVTSADAAARIFKMQGNAVIEIYPPDPYSSDLYRFRLADALSNTWYEGEDLAPLSRSILGLHKWTNDSIRVPTVSLQSSNPALNQLMDIVHQVADKVEAKVGERYFGNVSTRCMATFPSMRLSNGLDILVSPRNIDKTRLTAEDMILVTASTRGEVQYLGSRKPSVDTPVHLNLYQNHPKINYMIHGHAYIEGYPYTEEYFPCGDLREVPGISKIIGETATAVINLKNHGFLIASADLSTLRNLVVNAQFINRL